MNNRDVLKTVLTRFLPALLVLMATMMVAAAAAHNSNGIAGLKSVYLPTAIAQPLFMAIGYGVGLLLLRSRLTPSAAALPKNLGAAAVAVLSMTVASMFVQGIGRAANFGACLVVGVVVAFAFFLSGSRAPAHS